jgi:hypothetical protein
MEIDLTDLLKRTDAILLESKKRTFKTPDRTFVYFHFLTPVGWKQTVELEHYYDMVPTIGGYTPNRHLIIHGHDKWTVCAASHYCHLINYRPGPEHNPAFRKQFDLKWKDKYESYKN